MWCVLIYGACASSHGIIRSRLKCVFGKYISSSLLLLLILDLDTPVVNVSPTSPIEGVTVKFTCNVNTTDTINGYGWYYNGTQISGARSKEYLVTNANRSYSGYYSCNVTSQNFNKGSQGIMLTYICKCTFLYMILHRIKTHNELPRTKYMFVFIWIGSIYHNVIFLNRRFSIEIMKNFLIHLFW